VIDPRHILLTGGSGRLGTELRSELEGIGAPDEHEMDITDPRAVADALDARPGLRAIVHAAAFTDVARAETDRAACWRVNVEGTRNVAAAATARDLLLVHISTDYVFFGDRGGYREDEPVGPVRNYYALSKLVAEEIARLVPRWVVVRTSFRPRQWQHPAAFDDVFTSQDYVDVIAPQIALLIRRADEIPCQTVHVATERKSAYELARRRRDDVRRGSRRDVSVELPEDISLDVSKWQALKARWSSE
jgi:dTDP-4-dehydrorhamnose reductase